MRNRRAESINNFSHTFGGGFAHERGQGYERIQILLFPLRSTLEVRSLPRGPADSMPRMQPSHPHSRSAGGHRIHARPTAGRSDLGHARAKGQESLIWVTADERG